MHRRSDLRWIASCGAFVLGFLCSCGDSGDGSSAAGAFSKDTTCGAAIATSGALVLRVAPSDSSTACTSQTSNGSGIDAGFLFVDSKLSHVDLEIDEVVEGQTGDGFSARLTIAHDDDREWLGEQCTADIVEHEHGGLVELGRNRYRVRGSVVCESVASVPAGSGPALELESFEFVVSVGWTAS